MKINYLLIAFALFLFACTDDKDEPTPPTVQSEAILVGSEGGFMAENAELTLINRKTGEVFQDLFALSNDDAVLGDILQSMYAYQDEIYLVINNSGKIEVISQEDFKSKRTINGMTGPRYMVFLNSEKAYVSDISGEGIHVINPTTGTYTGLIETNTWIEHMVEHNGEVWCTAPNTDNLYVLNVANEQFTDTIELTAGVSDVVKDKNNNFWVLSQGTWAAPFVEPAIHQIDGETKEVLTTFSFPEGTGFGGSMTIAADKENLLYLLGGKIYKAPIDGVEFYTEQSFIEKSGVSFYSISVNQESGEIALTDAADFSQAGKVYFYKADGTAIDSYDAGVVPGSALWLKY